MSKYCFMVTSFEIQVLSGKLNVLRVLAVKIYT